MITVAEAKFRRVQIKRCTNCRFFSIDKNESEWRGHPTHVYIPKCEKVQFIEGEQYNNKEICKSNVYDNFTLFVCNLFVCNLHE